jgi:hypothetical protein
VAVLSPPDPSDQLLWSARPCVGDEGFGPLTDLIVGEPSPFELLLRLVGEEPGTLLLAAAGLSLVDAGIAGILRNQLICHADLPSNAHGILHQPSSLSIIRCQASWRSDVNSTAMSPYAVWRQALEAGPMRMSMLSPSSQH